MTPHFLVGRRRCPVLSTTPQDPEVWLKVAQHLQQAAELIQVHGVSRQYVAETQQGLYCRPESPDALRFSLEGAVARASDPLHGILMPEYMMWLDIAWSCWALHELWIHHPDFVTPRPIWDEQHELVCEGGLPTLEDLQATFREEYSIWFLTGAAQLLRRLLSNKPDLLDRLHELSPQDLAGLVSSGC